MGIYDRGLRGNVQNPFQTLGDASQIPYSNPRLPTAYQGNVQLGLDMVIDALYPNYKGTVANFAALPTTANPNDFYIVSDDGDGKSAGYVYSVIEGVAQWIKRYDVDYSAEGILSEAINRTQYMYVSKYGFSDHDQHGSPVTGQYAGQRIFGGALTGQNLTLTANVVDLTGVIQVDNHLLPTLFNTLDLGAASMKWRSAYFKSSLVVDTTTLMPGSLVDSSGAFSFNALNLSTTGTFNSGAQQISGTLLLSSGVVTDSSGGLSFAGNNLTTTGTLSAGVITGAASSKLADITFTPGTFSTASTAFNFSSKNLTGIASLTASGTITANTLTASTVNAGNLIAASNLLKTNSDTLSLILQGGSASASTAVQVASPLTVQQTLNVTGTSTFTGTATFSASPVQITSNLSLASVGTSATITSGGTLAVVAPSGVSTSGSVTPSTDNALNLGSASQRFKNLSLSGGLSDGTNSVSIASLTSLRDINTNATQGMSLFYNGTEWLPSIPDSEIDHRTLSGLVVGDSGHTQFALLAGRSGGQTLFGGLASGENLTLDSTSNATKGLVSTASTFAPATDSALDLGTSSKQFRNVYSQGLFYGLRFDQYAGVANYPTNASAKVGRVIWDTTQNQLLVDTGTAWSKVGNQKWLSDVSFDGQTLTQTVTVSANIADARTAVWQLLDNTNNFQQVFATLTKTQTQVTITSNPALPAGSYRLIGFN